MRAYSIPSTLNVSRPFYGRLSLAKPAGPYAPTIDAPHKTVIEYSASDDENRTSFLLDCAVRRILKAGKDSEDLTPHEQGQISAWLESRNGNPELLKEFLEWKSAL